MLPVERRILRRLAWSREIAPADDRHLTALAARGLVASTARQAPGPAQREWRITFAGADELGLVPIEQKDAA